MVMFAHSFLFTVVTISRLAGIVAISHKPVCVMALNN
jgi:hypothetical protein